MTDRELLELAAKAAGIFLTPETLADVFPQWEWTEEFEPRYTEEDGLSGTVVVRNFKGKLSGTTREYWNPLTDDGDALRLAVKLKIPVQFPDWNDDVRCWGPKYAPPMDEPFSGDPYAATRRAIVRAAAEIGKEKT